MSKIDRKADIEKILNEASEKLYSLLEENSACQVSETEGSMGKTILSIQQALHSIRDLI